MTNQELSTLFPDWSVQALEALTTIKCGALSSTAVSTICQSLNINVGQLQQSLLPLAESYAITPLSDFQVGAVALGTEHDAEGYPALYLGANLEFTQVGMNYTIHAEQSVTAVASAHGDKISALALNVTPCGMCRQLLHEHNTAAELPVLVNGENTINLSELLPRAFGPEDLSQSVYQPPRDTGLFNDMTAQQLLNQAQAFSYAPYSGSAIACVLETNSGASYPGFSLESAAYNPSLSALSVALILAQLNAEPVFSDNERSEFKRLTVLVKDKDAVETAPFQELALLWRQLAPEGEFTVVNSV